MANDRDEAIAARAHETQAVLVIKHLTERVIVVGAPSVRPANRSSPSAPLGVIRIVFYPSRPARSGSAGSEAS